MIRGRIRDIQPNQPRPTLELSFDAKDRSELPQGSRAGIMLDLGGVRWRGTMNSTRSNPPYLHTRLTQDSQMSTCTEVFLEHGLAEGAVLEFESDAHDVLRLIRVSDLGRWRPGNEPSERRARNPASSSQHEQPLASSIRSSRGVALSGIRDGDVERIAAALDRDFPVVMSSSDPAWSRAPAVRVIDCVLSLNRRYDAFVVPRLNRFENGYPRVTSVRALRALVDQYPTPTEFVRDVLDYRDPDRARILSSVVDFMLGIVGEAAADSELPRLEEWAMGSSPGDHTALGISGFALAGFQYLRMLFGANTTKPDTHIRGYAQEAVGRPVSDSEALCLLEAAAKRRGISLRDADTTIWEAGARSRHTASTWPPITDRISGPRPPSADARVIRLCDGADLA